MDYRAMMLVDADCLDREWLDHPGRYMEVVQNAVDARAEMDAAKDAMEVVAARLDAAIRAEPEKFGLSKVSESAVANAVLLQDEYQTARARYATARRTHALVDGAVSAFEHRKKALENLTQLTLQGYRAAPVVAGVTREQVMARASAPVHRDIQSRMNPQGGTGKPARRRRGN